MDVDFIFIFEHLHVHPLLLQSLLMHSESRFFTVYWTWNASIIERQELDFDVKFMNQSTDKIMKKHTEFKLKEKDVNERYGKARLF